MKRSEKRSELLLFSAELERDTFRDNRLTGADHCGIYRFGVCNMYDCCNSAYRRDRATCGVYVRRTVKEHGIQATQDRTGEKATDSTT